MLSLVPNSEFGAAVGVRAGIACVSVDFVGFLVVRFSLLVGWTVRACDYVRFLPKSFVGFALTAVGSVVLADTVVEYQIINSLNRTNALYNMVLPSLFGEMDLHQRNWHHFAVSGNQKTCDKAEQTASFFHPIMKNKRYKPNKTN